MARNARPLRYTRHINGRVDYETSERWDQMHRDTGAAPTTLLRLAVEVLLSLDPATVTVLLNPVFRPTTVTFTVK